MSLQLKGLWNHADFKRLWFSRTVSVFGSALTEFALPITANLYLLVEGDIHAVCGRIRHRVSSALGVLLAYAIALECFIA